MTPYSRLRCRAPFDPRIRVILARSLTGKPGFGAHARNPTQIRRDCPIGVRFTLTRNEGLNREMG
jgi:hypothetical protein